MNEQQSADRYIQTIMVEMLHMQQKSKAFIELITKNGSLSQNHIMLLIELKCSERMRITDISERFFITAGAATSMCDKLEEQDLVQRIRTKEDRRVVMVALTNKGEETINNLFKNFSEKKLREIAQVFGQINELMASIVEPSNV